MGYVHNDLGLDYDDVLIMPTESGINSRSEVDLEVYYNVLGYEVIPIIAANMDTVGTFETAEVLSQFKMITALHKFYTPQDFQERDFNPKYIAVSCGSSDKDLLNMMQILKENSGIKMICLDAANAYTSSFLEFVKKVRSLFPTHMIIAGNVSTPIGSLNLSQAGADFIKIGTGPGALCRTRTVTGVGVPQFSAVGWNSREYDTVADGGVVYFGDVAKAFGAGASFVMIGSMFAAHRENSPMGRNRTSIYGMASRSAHDKYYENKTVTPEGITVDIPIRGYLKDTVTDLLGALRSTLTYTGHMYLADFIGSPEFIKVNRTHNNFFGEK